MKGEQYFVTMRDGIEIHVNVIEKGHDKWCIATHGIGEHLGRNSFVPEQLSSTYNILQYDLRGHGLSMGDPAFVDEFNDFILDLDEIIGHLKSRYRMKNYVLFGHSMGALITANYMQNNARDSFYPESVFLSAPPIELPGFLGSVVSKVPQSIVSILSINPLSLKIPGLIDLEYLSHKLDTARLYSEDNKNHMSLHSKLLFEMIKCSKETFSKKLDIKCPGFVIVGSGDKVVSAKAIEKYFTEVEPAFKLEIVPGGYHELHNEIEKYKKPYIKFLKEALLS